MQDPWKSENGVGDTGATVTDNCEPLDMDAKRIEFSFSARSVCASLTKAPSLYP